MSELLNYKASGCVSDVNGYGPGFGCADVSRAEFFDAIYEQGFWQLASGGRGAASGPGSDLARTTRVRGVLAEVLERFGVRSMLDLACGDMTCGEASTLA